MRTISHTEAAAVYDCQAHHDFSYGEQLAGSSLYPKTMAPRLRDGIAWGRAMAAYHAGRLDYGSEMAQSLVDDATRQQAAGTFDEETFLAESERLATILQHYVQAVEPLGLAEPERRIVVPVPSRSGGRASSVYRYEARLDGTHVDLDGHMWIVEFKLRDDLSRLEDVVLGRQLRWYAWAYWRETGQAPAGVIVDERRKEAPRPVTILKSGKPSVDKAKLVDPDDYLAACRETGWPPDAEALEAYRARRWQARHVVMFRDGELVEAGRQLTSVARLVGDLDAGRLYPVRNPGPMTCSRCAFREICADPGDAPVVDALFDRRPPKARRGQEVSAA